MSLSVPPPLTHAETVDRHLTLRRSRPRPELEHISAVGEVDLVTAPTLRDVLEDVEHGPVPNVVVDLTSVSFLAVIGVRVLIQASARAASAGRRLVLVVSAPTVLRTLTLTNLSEELEVFGTASAALSALGLARA